jgi:inhibitor of KinA
MRFCPASDQSMLIYMGEEIALPTHQSIRKLLHLLQKEPPAWLRNVQPAYCSLLLTFDARRVGPAEVEGTLRQLAERAESARSAKPRSVEIPVCYDQEFAPDLDEVAKVHGLNAKEVIRLHTSRTYHAYFLGFAPGFAYLGELPEEIVTPRLEIPRTKVPAGSVAIAGKQTAIYPFATPGGWRLIGRTPLTLFRVNRKPMALISMGDQVRFRSISRKVFSELASR